MGRLGLRAGQPFLDTGPPPLAGPWVDLEPRAPSSRVKTRRPAWLLSHHRPLCSRRQMVIWCCPSPLQGKCSWARAGNCSPRPCIILHHYTFSGAAGTWGTIPCAGPAQYCPLPKCRTMGVCRHAQLSPREPVPSALGVPWDQDGLPPVQYLGGGPALPWAGKCCG